MTHSKTILALIAGILGITRISYAASFDCKTVTRSVDKAICASPKVSAMDSKMAASYKEAIKHAVYKNKWRNSQRAWIRERDKCADEACFVRVYERRIGELMPGSGGYDMIDMDKDPAGPFYRNVVYGIGPGLSACEKFGSGVPASLWGNREPVEIDDAVSPDGKVLTVTGTHADRTKSVYRFFLPREDCLASTRGNTTSTGTVISPNAKYIARLKAEYGNRLHFESIKAIQMVHDFNIDCRAPDRRTLPLINVLYARLASMDSKTSWLETFVQERGGEVRIIDSLRGPKITPVPDTIAFKIDKWGELRPVGIRAEAVLNACFGSSGPIWRP